MVITRVKNGSPDMISRHSKGNLMRKKMRYFPGFVDLMCFKIFNIGNLRVDLKDKNVHKRGPKGWPEFGMYLTTISPNICLYPKDPNVN